MSSVVKTIALTIMTFRDRFAPRLFLAIREMTPLFPVLIMSLPPIRAGGAHNFAILNSNDPISRLSDILIMCNHDDRLIEFLTHLFEENHNFLTSFTVEVSRRLIG
ncbi:hypothetical protein D3C75_1109100 [compost metagenome]